jgi:hypothetical protein
MTDNLLRHLRGAILVTHPLDAQPVVLAYRDRKLLSVLELTVDAGRIKRIDASVDPPKP